MNSICNYNANLVKLLIVLTLLFYFKQNILAQETDPITEALNKEKQETDGLNMYTNEQRELDHLNTKYKISGKEMESRSKQRSGQKIGISDKYRIARANRKEYVYNKKIEKFNRKIILNRQNEETRKRMLENEKSNKAKYKKVKRKQRKKKFLNLFK